MVVCSRLAALDAAGQAEPQSKRQAKVGNGLKLTLATWWEKQAGKESMHDYILPSAKHFTHIGVACLR